MNLIITVLDGSPFSPGLRSLVAGAERFIWEPCGELLTQRSSHPPAFVPHAESPAQMASLLHDGGMDDLSCRGWRPASTGSPLPSSWGCRMKGDPVGPGPQHPRICPPTEGSQAGCLIRCGVGEVKGLLRRLQVSGRKSSRVTGPEDGSRRVPLDDLGDREMLGGGGSKVGLTSPAVEKGRLGRLFHAPHHLPSLTCPPVPVLSSSVLFTHRLRSAWVPSCLGQSRNLQGRRARSSPSLWDSSLQEQKGELRKRLSYTTHRLEKLENEFDSTRHFLEIELRRAQEELEKVTEKLRRIQSNYMALQRINQELEDKLFRMGQHYEEEKRALSHEIVALNSHLLEAKVTIDKLSEDNELYRKDCSLAAQLLQCSQTYGRGRKMAELPAEFQERMNLHAEKPGCSLPAPLCRPAYADSVPPCVLAKVLEKPDPGSLSSHLSEASAQDLGFPEGLEKPGSRPPYKGDIYCSDTALYCPEERHRDRRPSVEGPGSDVGFLQAQNSTDSTAEEEEEEEEDTEAGAAAYPASYRHEAFGGYAASLPTSSSLFGRKPPAAYGSSPRYAAAAAAVAAPLEAAVAPGFPRTVSPFPAEPFRFPLSPGPQPALMPPNLWNLRAKPGSARLVAGAGRGQWRPLSVDDIGAYPFPAAAAAPAPSLASPGGFNDRYYGARGSPGENAEGRASPLYASYKADSFSEGDDLSQGHLVEPRYLRAAGDLSLSPGRSADPLPSYAASEGDRERLGVQLLGASGSPEPELSLRSSRDSLEPSSMEASPEMHPGARLSPQPAFPRAGSSGLSRKDSLTKAQLYGTLLN
ncbi:PREDICTED: brain-enriched guanylate kinase-associated protein [Bison bison bison]|uniref:Brain-enriched guanylate kinase-associated protein n=1 Tax=Bison bison bison TaxID=43346 RepID=A0A6P3IFR0_BISBB|nr:PREDICTED: brain-enriched guanylate kinase-associated protein [Bison bison bison]